MTTVLDLERLLERIAPARLAEAWDNVGLLLGDPQARVERVMTCLTVTDRTAQEAVAERADAVVSHHPILFRGAKSIRSDRPETSATWLLARAGIAVLSPHTAYDNAIDGINDGLARRIGLLEVGPLRPSPSPPVDRFKLVVFAPEEDRSNLLDAAFRAGAGRIGEYGECSYSGEGQGTFFGGPGSKPSVGEAGRRETVREWRIEVIAPATALPAVIRAVRDAHSYEEPAIDVYPLIEAAHRPGAGRVGILPEPESLGGFAARVRELLSASGIAFAGDPGSIVRRVAICCGAGDDFLPDARSAGADVLLTGEARFHRGLEAEAMGIGLVIAGHHATERPGVEDLAARLASELGGVSCWASLLERDPWRSL